jgi:hypothetical protein
MVVALLYSTKKSKISFDGISGQWPTHLFYGLIQIFYLAQIPGKKLNILVVVPLHKIENCYGRLSTSDQPFDNMTSEESTSSNDKV